MFQQNSIHSLQISLRDKANNYFFFDIESLVFIHDVYNIGKTLLQTVKAQVARVASIGFIIKKIITNLLHITYISNLQRLFVNIPR